MLQEASVLGEQARTLPPYLPLDAGSLGTSLGFQLALSFICAFPATTGGVVFIGVGVSFSMLIKEVEIARQWWHKP